MKAMLPKNNQLEKSKNFFPVIGVGASAGGLDAFKKLLKAIPIDSGMAFVLVQHLDPNHDSMLTEILQKVTPIPALQITEKDLSMMQSLYKQFQKLHRQYQAITQYSVQ